MYNADKNPNVTNWEGDRFKDNRHNCWNCGRIQWVDSRMYCPVFNQCLHFNYWLPIPKEEGDIDGID